MNDEILPAIRDFLKAFEEVFDSDWAYTKEMLGLYPPTPEEERKARELDVELVLEVIPTISTDGTFLHPLVDDETENWGWRGALLERYRHLKKLLGDS